MLFTTAIIPIAAIGGYFTIIYTMSVYEPTLQQEVIDSIGNYGLLLLASSLQAVVITVICGFFGHILSKNRLDASVQVKKKHLLPTSVATRIAGVIFGLDFWLFVGGVPVLHRSMKRSSPPHRKLLWQAFSMAVLWKK